MIPRTPWSTLFPYTTLFRSAGGRLRCPERRRGGFGGRLRHHGRSEEHTSELQSQSNLVCRLLLEKKKCVSLSDRPKNRIAKKRGEGSILEEFRMVSHENIVVSFFAMFVRTNFFFNDTPTTEIYTLSLHDALPIRVDHRFVRRKLQLARAHLVSGQLSDDRIRSEEHTSELQSQSNLVCRLLLE